MRAGRAVDRLVAAALSRHGAQRQPGAWRRPATQPSSTRFAERTENYEWRDADAHRRARARSRRPLPPRRCSFPDEAHLDPRRALPRWPRRSRSAASRSASASSRRRDAAPIRHRLPRPCRARRAARPARRARRDGGRALARVSLSRPVRMLHPRMPLYIVPRGDGRVHDRRDHDRERAHAARVSVRSAVELLNAAYALHPAFGEAEIVELGADLRPAFPDNLPRVAPRRPASCTSTACTGMASCSRRRWRAGRRSRARAVHSVGE